MTLLALVFVFFVANFYEIRSAPATYDQRQTGDFNAMVDVKDVGIVIVESFGDYGDYDLYDYAEFTIKPITHSTTTSAPITSSSTSVKPWHTWPTKPSTSSSPTTASSVDSVPHSESESVNKNPEKNATSSVTVATPSSSSSSSEPENSPITLIISNETPEPPSALPEPQTSPITIETINFSVKTGLSNDDVLDEKEEIVEIPAASVKPTEIPSSSDETSSTVAPVVGENSSTEASNDQIEAQNEPLKKCSPGYTRDQQGRCSRLHGRRRIPSSLLPFGIRLTPRIHRHRDNYQPEIESAVKN